MPDTITTLSEEQTRAWLAAYHARLCEAGLANGIEFQTFDRDEVCHAYVVDKPGCYIARAVSGEIIYIGMSETSVRKRLQTLLSKKVQASEFWLRHDLGSFDVIEVEESWEAPSLEAYLTKIAKPFLSWSGE